MLKFSDRVYRIIKRVPKGKVTTYMAIARSLGNPKSSRAVGNALHTNPNLVHIPCHRVVRSNGEIGGYAGGQKKKIVLLRREGVEVKNNKVDLHKYFLDLTRKKW
ncbi:MAG: MGMT family protein [Candidatus Magasanikbacteria bacterium]